VCEYTTFTDVTTTNQICSFTSTAIKIARRLYYVIQVLAQAYVSQNFTITEATTEI
jgi:hypothetical protein